MSKLRVGNIQRFSVDDGPGIRTTVFLKGCNLRCLWCHNPENITSDKILQFHKEQCVCCGKCVQVCPEGVHEIREGRHTVNRERCQTCGKCVEECLYGALSMQGQQMTAEELETEIKKDTAYYRKSGGGVTFSGGEPMLQYENLLPLLQKLKKQKIPIAVDTAGCIPFEWYEKILPYTDLFLFDIKAYTEKLHLELTGQSNQNILENIFKLQKSGAKVWVRIPLIPGLNDNREELEAICTFLQSMNGIERIEPLTYHSYGVGKYEISGLNYGLTGLEPPDPQMKKRYRAAFSGLPNVYWPEEELD